jgi:hypothetical protein
MDEDQLFNNLLSDLSSHEFFNILLNPMDGRNLTTRPFFQTKERSHERGCRGTCL